MAQIPSPSPRIAIIAAGCSCLAAMKVLAENGLPADFHARAYAEGLATEKEFLKSPRHAVEVHYYPYLRKLQKLATG